MLSLLHQHITARTDSFEVALKTVLSLIKDALKVCILITTQTVLLDID